MPWPATRVAGRTRRGQGGAEASSVPSATSGQEALAEGGDGLIQRGRDLVAQRLRLVEGLEDVRALGLEEAIELRLEVADPRRRDVVELALGGRVQDRDLLLDRDGLVLRLLRDLGQLLAAGQLVAGRLVKV